MTGGMAFVYDKNKNFKNYANPASIVWQSVETKYWKDYLRNRIEEFTNETGSLIGAKILKNFSEELNNFVQVCPFEMLDKLENPITLNIEKKIS